MPGPDFSIEVPAVASRVEGETHVHACEFHGRRFEVRYRPEQATCNARVELSEGGVPKGTRWHTIADLEALASLLGDLLAWILGHPA